MTMLHVSGIETIEITDPRGICTPQGIPIPPGWTSPAINRMWTSPRVSPSPTITPVPVPTLPAPWGSAHTIEHPPWWQTKPDGIETNIPLFKSVHRPEPHKWGRITAPSGTTIDYSAPKWQGNWKSKADLGIAGEALKAGELVAEIKAKTDEIPSKGF